MEGPAGGADETDSPLEGQDIIQYYPDSARVPPPSNFLDGIGQVCDHDGRDGGHDEDVHQDGGDDTSSTIPAGGSVPPRAHHFPLDMPGLSFSRYEHRRLGARDAMVHRIMSELMRPRRVPPEVFAAPQTRGHQFSTVPSHDQGLYLDLRALRNMVFLEYDEECGLRRAYEGEPRIMPLTSDLNVEDSREMPHPVGHEVLDLLQRHYFEMDDNATRLWLHSLRHPLGPVQPYAPRSRTVPESSTTTAGAAATTDGSVSEFPPKGTRAEAVQNYWARQGSSFLGSEGQRWDSSLKHHVASLQPYKETQERLALYDGGAATPLHRQVLDLNMSATNRELHLVSTTRILPGWAESAVLRRFKLRAGWDQRKIVRNPLFLDSLPVFDPPRGRGPHWYHRLHRQDMTAVFRDQTSRRSLSEPPPGMFAYAKMPCPKVLTAMIDVEIAFPKLSLSDLDRRSRRRSLSRSHIRDMFCAPGPYGDDGQAGGCLRQQEEEDEEEEEGENLWRGESHRLPEMRRRLRQRIRRGSLADAGGPRAWNATQMSAIWASHGGGLGSTSMRSYILVDQPCRFCKRHHHRGPGGEHTVEFTRPHACVGRPSQGIANWLRADGLLARFWTSCVNCLGCFHNTDECPCRCGHCGAMGPRFGPLNALPALEDNPGFPGMHNVPHLAPDCTVAPGNRCKCVPFPTFHTAKRCAVTCSRPCGNPYPPGHFRHRNAMTCRHRCCMCGIRGHSGRECRLRTCRCGGEHLGQDCGWNPACRVQGCDRYLCGVHCRGCGSRKRPFVEWLCLDCEAKRPGRPTSSSLLLPPPQGDSNDGGEEGLGGGNIGGALASQSAASPPVVDAVVSKPVALA